MASVLKNILLGNQYIGIEFFTINGEDAISILYVNKKKGELLVSQDENFYDRSSLSTIKAKAPVALVVNNSHVLLKEIEGIDENDKKLLHKAFPNLKVEEFYYEIWRYGNNSVISLCRKIYIDNLLASLKPNLRISQISIGPSAAAYITDFIDAAVITTNTQEINLKGDKIIFPVDRQVDNEYLINGLSVQNTSLLAFCGTLKFLIPNPKTTGSIATLDHTLADSYMQQTFFEKVIFASVLFLLVLLSINFLLFSHFFDEAGKITASASINKAELENIKKTEIRIRDKERKIVSYTSSNNSESSLIINEIVERIPSSILLSDIDYQPLQKKIREEEFIQVEENRIIISGNILSLEAFTQWIGQMEKSPHIKELKIMQFGKNQDNLDTFTLEVNIK